jgi:hypothetical protein
MITRTLACATIVLMTTTAASADVVVNSVKFGAVSSIKSYAADVIPIFGSGSQSDTMGNTASFSQHIDSGTAPHMQAGCSADWSGNTSSSLVGSLYSWSGAFSQSVTGLGVGGFAQINDGGQLGVTFDSATTIDFTAAWSWTNSTADGVSIARGVFRVLELDGAGNVVDTAFTYFLAGDNQSIQQSVTLGAGTYSVLASVQDVRNYSEGFPTTSSGVNWNTSIQFSNAGGGAVPGLGALAPLAAAGLTRRRRR